MRLSQITTLAVALAPALAFPETYYSAGSNEEILLRRNPTKAHIVRRGGSTQSSSSADQAEHNPTTGQEPPPLGNLSLGPSRVSSSFPRPEGSLPLSSMRRKRLALSSSSSGSDSESSSKRSSSPHLPQSSGDSDSSADDAEGKTLAKLKVKATGPAGIQWSTGCGPLETKLLAQDEEFKRSIHAKDGAYMCINTNKGNPAGKAQMTARGSRDATSWMHSQDAGSGKITPLHPPKAPVIVPGGEAKIVPIRSRRESQRMRRIKANINGPGSITGDVANWQKTADRG